VLQRCSRSLWLVGSCLSHMPFLVIKGHEFTPAPLYTLPSPLPNHHPAVTPTAPHYLTLALAAPTAMPQGCSALYPFPHSHSLFGTSSTPPSSPHTHIHAHTHTHTHTHTHAHTQIHTCKYTHTYTHTHTHTLHRPRTVVRARPR
jgi:hypothetical protein